MNYQENLIKFVQLKNEIIETKTDLTYINQEDVDCIKQWPEKICKEVYQELETHIQYGNISGITDGTCIWCIENGNNSCYECEYGTRHGICNHIGSSYESYSTNERSKLFTNEVYKEIIKKIKMK